MLFQSLEARCLFTLPVVGGVLTINGTDANDRFEITQGAGGILTLRNLSNNFTDVSAAAVNSLVVNGNAGNDLIRLRKADGSAAVQVRSVVNGGAGNDTLIGGNNDDELRGNDGDDLMDGRAGSDVMNGGIGFDTADYSARGGAVVVALDGAANDGSSGEEDNVTAEGVLGGTGADRLFGNSSPNFLDGDAGNDTIVGGGGNDTLNGGTGADSVFGETGNDFVATQENAVDRVSGGDGTDSAVVDSTAAGDPVDDLPTSGAAPAAPSTGASDLAFALFAADVAPAATSGVSFALDPSFGGDGTVIATIDGFDAQINDVAVQSDGKIVVVGTALVSRPDESSDYDLLLIRFNADGTLDGDFGNAGIVLTDVAGFNNDVATSLVIDDSDRIIVAGSTVDGIDGPFDGDGDYVTARYDADGDLDDNFSDDGIATADLSDGGNDRASDVAIQTIGGVDRYVVVGGSEGDFGLIRWTEAGALDDGFGIVRSDFGSVEFPTFDVAAGVAIDPATGNIWVAGTTAFFDVEFSSTDAIVAGYDPDGDLIADSGPQDFFDGGVDIANDLAIEGNRAIVVGNARQSGFIAAFDITPGANAGDLLNSELVTGDATSIVLQAVALDIDGNGVAVGTLDNDFFVYGFDTQSLVGNDGVAVTDFGSIDIGFDRGFAVAIQDDGRIVAAGLTGDDAAVARYTVSGAGGGGTRGIAENILTDEEFQDYEFTYDITEIDQNGNVVNSTGPLPDYLVYRIRPPVTPDGVATFEGTPDEDLIFISQSGNKLIVDLNSVIYTFKARKINKLVIDGLAGNDQIVAGNEVKVPLDLIGGSGHDILVGGYGRDVLAGGLGRDIVIGNHGNDRLNGDEDEDILIGGETNFGTDTEALTAIRAEWTSNHSYKVRIANIGGQGAGNGLNGRHYLRPGSGHNKTVMDDGHRDTLLGGAGTDWFLADTGCVADVLDAVKGETVTKV